VAGVGVIVGEHIRSGATSSREVIEAHLGRIDEVNGAVNAVVEVRPDEVRAEADAADAKQKAGEALGALHGVPFTIKINLDVKGYTSNEGCVTLKDFMANDDAPPVELMRRAGPSRWRAPTCPTSAAHQYGILALRRDAQSLETSRTRWLLRREAAAIASGMSPIGLGNDIGGSLRNPAYACGIASIKPSRGRVAQGNPRRYWTCPSIRRSCW